MWFLLLIFLAVGSPAWAQQASCEDQRDGMIQYADVVIRSRAQLEAQLAEARLANQRLLVEVEKLKKGTEQRKEAPKP